jgi:hypothetical protein
LIAVLFRRKSGFKRTKKPYQRSELLFDRLKIVRRGNREQGAYALKFSLSLFHHGPSSITRALDSLGHNRVADLTGVELKGAGLHGLTDLAEASGPIRICGGRALQNGR